ncbi:MAG: MFS transporter [Beijerinckiaceae bacterium]
MAKSRSKPPLLRVLSHRNFALFEGGLFPQYLTGWVQRVGAGWLAWNLTESPTWLGIIAAADLAPMLVLAPFAGAVADRLEPLRLIRLAQTLLMLQAVAMVALMASGYMRIEFLFLLTFFNGLVYPFHSTARQSIIPSAVPREDFSSAVAVDSACFHSNRFIGPAIAAFIIPAFGVTGAFVAHAIGSFVSVAAFHVLDLPPPDRSRRSRGNLFGDVGRTFVYAWNHRAIRPLLLILLCASFFVRPVQDMLPGFAEAVFKGDARTLAWLTSAMGVGALLGALHVAMRGGVRGLTNFGIVGYFCTAAGGLGFAATQNIYAGMGFVFVAGYGLNVMSTCVQALMQLAVDDHVRGRVLSLYLLIYRGIPALGALIVGVGAEVYGLQLAQGAGAVLCVAMLGFIWPARKPIIDILERQREAV